jgi:2-keto-4-pentenoate hydratase/2-oxohepta-3-ene-1,7-dioic acid hydratase in catechol pathway
MRWVTCRAPDLPGVDRVGLVVDETVRVPDGVASLLALLGDDGTKLRQAAERAQRTPSKVLALSDVRLLPPIPEPRSIRDYSSFEAHYRAGLKAIGREFDPAWYESPVFYFSSPHVTVGDAVDVLFPAETREMDFELEVAAIVGREGTDLSLDEAEACIAGYAIFNDWSARDLLRTDLRRSLLGPSKGKDSNNGLGPYFVTPDELEGRRKGKGYDLAMTARVNGREVSRGNWSDIYWSFAEMVAHASRNSRVVSGDVIASGTVGTGCIMELAATHGTERFPWLRDGDEVVVAIESLGELHNCVYRGRAPER